MIVPRQDWDRPPYNRWSFQHVREILPTAEVWRGQGPARDFARREVALDGLEVQSINGRVSLSQFLTETYADGILVIKNGAIAFERYFNGMEPRTLHLSQSVAKSFTGALAGILVGQGLLDVKAPITDYLPELNATAWKGATFQHVLDMSSGTRFNEEYTDPYSDIGRVDVASGWKGPPADGDPHFKWPQHMWELILGLKQQAWPHGDRFEYRSIETDVLAFVMERVAGKRLPQLLSEQLWQKAGMEESANFTVDPAGYAIADGGLSACLRDYGRFGQLILEGGGGIIPSSWIEATRNGDHTKFGAPYSNILPRGAYHNQFWIEDAEHRTLMCRGVFGQLIYISWQYQIVIVKLSTWPEFVNPKFMAATLRACHAIGSHLSS